MEIKTKFDVYQTVFSAKDDYVSPKVIQSIKIDAYDFHSNDIVYNTLYDVEDEHGNLPTVPEEQLAATREQALAAKVQSAIDELERLREKLAELNNE